MGTWEVVDSLGADHLYASSTHPTPKCIGVPRARVFYTLNHYIPTVSVRSNSTVFVTVIDNNHASPHPYFRG